VLYDALLDIKKNETFEYVSKSAFYCSFGCKKSELLKTDKREPSILNVMRKIILIIFLLLVLRSAYSQSDFVPGFVQVTKQDTLFGLIDYRVDKANILECRFKRNDKDTVQVFSPAQIYGYRFTNSKYYVSRNLKTKAGIKTLFLEYLVEGVVDLYYYRDQNNDHYLVEKHDLPITEISFPKEIIQENGKEYERNVMINRNVLKFYLQDCPEMYGEIDALVGTHHKRLIQLVKKYHDIQCPGDVCIIYQKKMPKFRIDIQPVIGYTNLNTIGILFQVDRKTADYSLQYGVLSYIWLPLDNERLFLKTGFILNRIKGYSWNQYMEENGVKVPLQLHYQFLKTNVTPVISAGINIYSTSYMPFYIFPDLNLGVNAKITDKLYATLSFDFDYFSELFIIPRDSRIVSHSLNLGVAIKL